MLKFLAYLICYAVYPFSFLMPRTRRIMAFGSYRGAFNDNTKYFFIYASEHLAGRRCVWLSANRHTVDHVRSLGYEAHLVYSPRGAWLALRARLWFVNSYTSDIMFCLSGGATVVNLWHALSNKCIEFGITQGELRRRYVERQFWDVFYHPASFRRPDFMASTTPWFDRIYARSFRISERQCLHVGMPRNRFLMQPDTAAVETFVNRYEGEETRQVIQTIRQYDRTLVYMPTWRDSQADLFANGFDFDALDQVLRSQNALMIMKPHANTRIERTTRWANLMFLDGTVDMYTILPFTHVLITDYSSIMFDYMLMPDKPIILFHYDYEEYVRQREFNFPFEGNSEGRVVRSFDELLHIIDSRTYDVDHELRRKLVDRFWGESIEHDACQNIIRELGLQ